MKDYQFATAWVTEMHGHPVQFLAHQGVLDDEEAGQVLPAIEVKTWHDDIFFSYMFTFSGDDGREKVRRAMELLAADNSEQRQKVEAAASRFFEEHS